MTTSMELMSEIEFRKKNKELFQKIEIAFDKIDPDWVEVNVSQGSMVLVLEKKVKIIVSLQVPVRQIWLALAHRGEAHHFDWDPSTKTWVDDKTGKLKFPDYLEQSIKDYFKKTTQPLNFTFQP
jgi:iron donor protein CyaY